METVNLFFAFKPPPAIAREMAHRGAVIGGAHHLTGHWMGPARLHMTLALCHQGREGLTAATARAIAMGDSLRHAPVGLAFDRTESFNRGSNAYPFVLSGGPADDVRAFRAMLRDHMRRAGFAATSGFTPHVTLAWADRLVAPHPIAPICWTAEELLLIESPVGPSRHVHVARWPLH